MSGYRSGRFYLTEKEKAILKAARIERKKTMEAREKIKRLAHELLKLDNDIYNFCNSLNEKNDKNTEEIIYLNTVKRTSESIQDVISSDFDTSRDLNGSLLSSEKLEKVLREARIKFKEIKEQGSKIKNEAIAKENEKINNGFVPPVEGSDENSNNNLLKKDMDEAMEIMNKLHNTEEDLSIELREQMKNIKEKFTEIKDPKFIKNFILLTLRPFNDKCEEYLYKFEIAKKRYEQLIDKYNALCDICGILPENISMSEEGMDYLETKINDLEVKAEECEDQEYISQAMDSVMEELGYEVIGARKVKNDLKREFENKVYSFVEGTGVNVTYDANGKIIMEICGLDDLDREANVEEADKIKSDMKHFCNNQKIIEAKLKEKGILFSEEKLLPPSTQYAQILNMDNYTLSQSHKFTKISDNKKKKIFDTKKVIKKEQ